MSKYLKLIKAIHIPNTTERGKRFIDFTSNNYIWHANIHFNTRSKQLQIYEHQLAESSISIEMYLRAIRQELWRRCRLIRGFVPMVGYNCGYNEVLLISNISGRYRNNFVDHCDQLMKSEVHENILRWSMRLKA